MYRRSLLIKGTQSGQISRFKEEKSSRMQHGKKRRSLNSQENLRTGIGLYCQLLRQNREETIMIQASTAQPSSLLLAETVALLLASKIASQLQAQGVTFLTDNIILAKAAAASSVTNEQVPWELRQQIADYKRASE